MAKYVAECTLDFDNEGINTNVLITLKPVFVLLTLIYASYSCMCIIKCNDGW